jgi:hypothetical protein
MAHGTQLAKTCLERPSGGFFLQKSPTSLARIGIGIRNALGNLGQPWAEVVAPGHPRKHTFAAQAPIHEAFSAVFHFWEPFE